MRLDFSSPTKAKSSKAATSRASRKIDCDDSDDDDDDGESIDGSVVDFEEPDDSQACALPQLGQVSRLRKTTRKFFWNVAKEALRAEISFPARIQILLAKAKPSKRLHQSLEGIWKSVSRLAVGGPSWGKYLKTKFERLRSSFPHSMLLLEDAYHVAFLALQQKAIDFAVASGVPKEAVDEHIKPQVSALLDRLVLHFIEEADCGGAIEVYQGIPEDARKAILQASAGFWNVALPVLQGALTAARAYLQTRDAALRPTLPFYPDVDLHDPTRFEVRRPPPRNPLPGLLAPLTTPAWASGRRRSDNASDSDSPPKKKARRSSSGKKVSPSGPPSRKLRVSSTPRGATIDTEIAPVTATISHRNEDSSDLLLLLPVPASIIALTNRHISGRSGFLDIVFSDELFSSCSLHIFLSEDFVFKGTSEEGMTDSGLRTLCFRLLRLSSS